MINPSQAWCAQIDITNACHLHCSNCTRLLDHARKRYFMSVECFEQAVKSLSTWVSAGDRDLLGRGKVVGMIGGEPLLHPEFPSLVDLMIEHIPNVQSRGLWTSKDWKTGSHPRWGAYAPQVERLVGPHEGNGRGNKQGWLNWNMHLRQSNIHHQPVLTASKDLVPDDKQRWELISKCWLQEKWSPTITPKGFYFCEVAGAIDMVLGGVGGIELGPECWTGKIKFTENEHGVLQPQGKFANQILNACQRCGVCVPQQGRLDRDEIDDVSQTNLARLNEIDSPRLAKGRINLVDLKYSKSNKPSNWNPRKYDKGGRPIDQSEAAKQEKVRQ